MSVRRGLLASIAGEGWTALLQLALIPVYVSILGVEAWGLIGALAVFTVVSAVVDAALGPPLSREAAAARADLQQLPRARGLLRSVEILIAGVGVAVGLAGIAAAGSIAGLLRVEHLEASSVALAIRLFFLHLAVRFLAGPYRAVVVGAQELVWLNAFFAGVATVRGLGVIPVLVWWPRVEAFFAFQLVVGAVEVALLRRKAWRLVADRSPAAFSPAALIDLRRFAVGAASTSILWNALHQSDRALLSACLPLAEVGQYALAASAAAPLGLIVGPFASVGFARFADLSARRDQAGLAQSFHQLSQGAVLALAPAAFTLALFAEPLLLAWTRDVAIASEAAPFLTVLAIGGLLKGCMSLPYTLPLALGRSTGIARSYAVMLAAFIPATYFGAPFVGGIAAAYAWVLVTALGLFLAFTLLAAALSPADARRWLAFDVALPGAAAGIGAGLVRSMADADSSPTVLAALVVAAYLASLALTAVAAPTLRPRPTV